MRMQSSCFAEEDRSFDLLRVVFSYFPYDLFLLLSPIPYDVLLSLFVCPLVSITSIHLARAGIPHVALLHT